ncbi:membrane hypothetical protein [Gammaproteobacteria bacterium]
MSDQSPSLGKAVLKLVGDDTQLVKDTKKAKTTVEGLLGNIGEGMKLAGKGLLAIGTSIAAIGVAIGALVLKEAARADQLAETAAKTNLSTQALQEYDYIGKQIGVDTDTIVAANARLVVSMSNGRDGASDQGAAFKALGVDVEDGNGKLRDSTVVFDESLAALRDMKDVTEREALSNKLFGKSYQELNPLISTSKEEMERLRNEAHTVGAVMSDETVQGLAGVNDVVDSLKSSLSGTAGELAFTFLPAFKQLGGGMQGYMTLLSNIVKNSDGDYGKMAEGIGGLVVKILTDLANQAPKMVEVGLSLIMGLVNALIAALPQLLPLAIQIIMTLIQGLATAIPQLLISIATLIPKLVISLLQQMPLIIKGALDLILGLATGLIAAIPILIEQAPTIMLALVNGIIDSLPEIILAGVQLVMALVFGIIQNIPLLLAATPKMIQAIIDQFKSKEFKDKMAESGKALIDGLSSGWTKSWTDFKKNIVKNFDDMVAVIKNLLGIKSPSKVFEEMGGFSAAGFGVGFFDQFDNIQREINSVMQRSFNLNPAYAGSGSVNNSDSYQFYAPIIIQGGQTLRQSLRVPR